MDEEAILKGLCQRDSNSQKIFWEQYWPGVYAICARILGKGTDATDLAVDLLTEFIDIRVQNVENPAAMKGYLRLMAVRRALDLKKKRSRFSALEYDIQDSSGLTPEDEAMINSLMPRLNHCLSNLTEKARQALRLKFTEQWSNERIGDILGGSRQYIGRLLQQSQMLLRDCIEKGLSSSSTKEKGDLLMPWKKSVCAEDVALLLSHSAFPRDEIHHQILQQIALVRAGKADQTTADAVALHLDVCEQCQEAVRELDSMLHEIREEMDEINDADSGARTPNAGTTEAEVKSGDRKSVPRFYTYISLAAAILVIGTLVVWWHGDALQSTQTPQTPDTASQLYAKGTEDKISIVIRRENRLINAGTEDVLQDGDNLGFFYSTKTPAYFALFARDNEGNVFVQYPADSATSIAVKPGDNVSLPDGAAVESPGKCEWVVGVFSDKPLQIQTMIATIKKAEFVASTCGLKLKIKNARTQIIYTFKGSR